MIPQLAMGEISDQFIRKNFERIADFFRTESPLDGFRAITSTFSAVGTSKISHTLGFQPKDIIVTSLSGAGIVQFNYSQFTATELSVTISGAVTPTSPTTVRFLVGTLGGLK